MPSNKQFEVLGYSEGLWCIVDHSKETADTLPVVRWHHRYGWKMIFSDKAKAESLAEEMNRKANGPT